MIGARAPPETRRASVADVGAASAAAVVIEVTVTPMAMMPMTVAPVAMVPIVHLLHEPFIGGGYGGLRLRYEGCRRCGGEESGRCDEARGQCGFSNHL